MQTRPSISIITPTYNRRAVLARAIRSVQRQTFTDYEHLIIDDGSEDGTADLVRSLGDHRIRFVRFPTRRGANAARNAGVERARAHWLTFLDSDDEYLPSRLSAFIRWQESARGELLISSFQTMKRGRPRPAANPTLLLTPRELEQALVLHAIFIAGSSITVSATAIRRAGAFDEQIGRMQDREVLLRLARRHGAQLSANIDWVKHPSSDSISGGAHGYVRALGALFAAHPDLQKRYRDTIAYHVARRILAEALGGHWSQARCSLAENRSAETLQFSLAELATGYLRGWSERRQFRDLLSHQHRTTVPALPAATWQSRTTDSQRTLARAA